MRALATVYKCSDCFSPIRGVEYLSGNTVGGVVYSDTYTKAPMKIPEGYQYVGCSSCKNVFDKKDLEVLEHYDEKMTDEQNNEYKAFPDPMLHFDMLKILLEDSKFSNENQKAFTLWYLWAFNHEIKPEQKQEEVENGNYKKYTDRLIEILGSEIDNINSVVLKAEILRERGVFDEAEKILDSVDKSKFTTEKIQYVFEEIKNKISKKDSAIFEVEKKSDFIR